MHIHVYCLSLLLILSLLLLMMQFYRASQAIQRFAVQDLSNFYLDTAKDRLYISEPTAQRRRSCQTVLYTLLINLSKVSIYDTHTSAV
jgi:isoleucyl-tRNA synthetase